MKKHVIVVFVVMLIWFPFTLTEGCSEALGVIALIAAPAVPATPIHIPIRPVCVLFCRPEKIKNVEPIGNVKENVLSSDVLYFLCFTYVPWMDTMDAVALDLDDKCRTWLSLHYNTRNGNSRSVDRPVDRGVVQRLDELYSVGEESLAEGCRKTLA